MDLPLSSRLRETHDPIGGETFCPRHGTNIVRLLLYCLTTKREEARARWPHPTQPLLKTAAVWGPLLYSIALHSRPTLQVVRHGPARPLALSPANSLLLGLVNI
jgi:hypothetical protein